MNGTSSLAIGYDQLCQLTRVFAAINQYYIATQWSGVVFRAIAENKNDAIAWCRGERPESIHWVRRESDAIVQAAQRLCGKKVRSFHGPTFERHREEVFTRWVSLAVDRSETPGYARFKRESSTAFVWLTPNGQQLAYKAAVGDVKTLAQAGGLVLPPEVPWEKLAKPQSSSKLLLQRFAHSCNLHGQHLELIHDGFEVYDNCHACHRRVMHSK